MKLPIFKAFHLSLIVIGLLFLSTSAVQAQQIMQDDDQDGMDDTWESNNGLDASDQSDAWLDLDDDAVINLFEFQLGSDPNDGASPVAINANPAGDLDVMIEALTEPTLIRVTSGTYEPDVDYFKGAGIEDAPINVMIQGGWNEDFTVRDTDMHQALFTDTASGRILDFFFSTGSSTVIVDGITFTDGAALFVTTSDSSFAAVSLHNVRATDYLDMGSLVGTINIDTQDSSAIDFNIIRSLTANNEGSVFLTATGTSHIDGNVLHTVLTNNLAKDISSFATGFDVVALDEASIAIDITNSVVWGNHLEILGGDIRAINDVTVDASHSVIGQVSEFPVGNFVAGEMVLDEDPLFADAASGDYHLMPESNLINNGKDVGLPFYGSAPEIGLYEIIESSTSIDDETNLLTEVFTVEPPFPNPFQTSTSFVLQVQQPTSVVVSVYDILGREVRSFPEVSHAKGQFTYAWDGKSNSGSDLPAGIYFVRTHAGDTVHLRRVVLLP